ncbi:MAG: acyl-CoA dehydrogenase [Chloroflexi bacterium]|nr:acyl-CoA dehydrogenase [Chloroflexota bacterium]
MPTIDDFLRPKEWIPEIVLDIGKVVRQWGEEKYIPIRRQIDEDWKEHKLVKPLMKELLVDLGLAKGGWPAEVGGLDIPNLAVFFCVIADELSRFDSAFALAVAISCGWPLLPVTREPHRNMELCREFGPRFCGDELYTCCMDMTEPAGGSDIENVGRVHGKTIKTSARLQGGDWVINGQKLWPSNADADLHGVLCSTNPGSSNEDDLALIYVPRDTKGVTVGAPYHKAGMAADYNSDIWFDDVKVPKRYRAHGPGDDAKYFREILTFGNVAGACLALGPMKNTYEIIKKWTSERVVFGRPLKEHSINAAVLAEIIIDIEASSIWLYTLANQLDNPDIYGIMPWDEAMVYRSRAASLFVTDAGVHATNRAMELMGSYGYCREYDLEKHWRDVKMTTLWMGGRQLDLLEIARYWYDIETL